MRDGHIDQLAQSAGNRGLKLVRSRVRTPGKRRFGKVGLTDKAGKAVFGLDEKGPNASPEEVEHYLRNLGAKDWGASLDVAVLPRKRKPGRIARPREPANDAQPASEPKPRPERAPPPPPKPKPEPVPQVRDARPRDAAALGELIGLLGAKVDEKGVRKRLTALARDKLAPLVATLDKQVIGLCGIHRMVTVHRDQPVGRITILVVAERARKRGIGRMLTRAAEDKLRKLGCSMVEVMGNDRLAPAQAFCRHLGYDRTGIRFMKQL